jgi:hypothetical protein
MKIQSGNFAFLKSHDAQLVRLGALAERYFHDDPNTCLIKLRQFGELLAQLIAAKTGLFQTGDESQVDLLRRLRFDRLLPSEVADLFDTAFAWLDRMAAEHANASRLLPKLDQAILAKAFRGELVPLDSARI